MTITNKILIAIIAVLGVGGIIFFVYQAHLMRQQTQDIQNSVIEMKHLKDEVVRSQSQYVNQKGFEDFVKQNQVNLDAIQKDVKSLGGKIDAINVATATSQGQIGNNIPSTTTITTNPPVKKCTGDNCVEDKFGYYGTIQSLQLNENFGKVSVPFGQISFYAGSQDNKPWGYQIPEREYKIANTIAHSASGQTVVYNALSIKSGDKNYEIPLAASNTVEIYPSPTFSWWNPRLAVGASGSIAIGSGALSGEATPSLSVSAMSYGKTKLAPDMRIISLGVGYNVIERAPSVEFSPIMLNVAKGITGGSLLSNVYLGPTVGLSTKGTFTAGIGFQVGL